MDIAKRSKISADEEIIFVGWIMGNEVQGLKNIREDFTNIKAICGVGMMKGEKAEKNTVEKSGITEPYFFLTGDFDISKLTGMYKMMMGMMMRMMKSKVKESGEGGEMLELLEKGIKGFDEKELDAVIEFLA